MEDRIQNIEEKIAYLERHLVEQDKVILELNEAILRLLRDLHGLRQTLADPNHEPARALPEDGIKPPHY